MLPVKDIFSRTWGTPTRSISIPDISPSGTPWEDSIISFEIESEPQPVWFESQSYTLEDSPGFDYQVVRPIPVVLEKDEGCFVASFNEANIHASGDTPDEAINNLRSYIGDVFDEFLALGDKGLGPGPRQEFDVLRTYIHKRDAE